MEKIDPQKAEKVWQRVRGEQKQETAVGVQTMVAWEKEIEALLQLLNKKMPDKGYGFQQMIADTRRHIACLQGIRQLSGEKPGVYSPGNPGVSEPGAMLRRCYGQCLRVGAKYAALAEDPQYGCVFGDMARTKRRHCGMILEILGGL